MADDDFTADFLSLPEDPPPAKTEATDVPKHLQFCSCGHCGGMLVNRATDWRHRLEAHARFLHGEEMSRSRGVKRKSGEGNERTRKVQRGERESQLNQGIAGMSQNCSLYPSHCYQ